MSVQCRHASFQRLQLRRRCRFLQHRPAGRLKLWINGGLTTKPPQHGRSQPWISFRDRCTEMIFFRKGSAISTPSTASSEFSALLFSFSSFAVFVGVLKAAGFAETAWRVARHRR